MSDDRPMSTISQDPGDRVWIEVTSTVDPIAGEVHDGDAPPRQFRGWVELMALLDSLRDRPERDPGRAAPG
jgi:hypothetical protein